MAKILDTTLRDGSYVVDFKINAQQTFDIAKALDNAGFSYIETGHGLGLNATTKQNMIGASSDEAWLEATAAAVTNNKWGMFFIPGIGTESEIELASKYKMDFIRIGANVNEYERAEKYIKLAKEKGMFVYANFMKSYAVSFEEFGVVAANAVKMGADLVCIVDSAGAMLPEDVEGYVKAVKQNTDAPIGFHGHNNLGLANINSIVALELGVDVIDTSLRGFGRSAGNTVTEIFLLTLLRKNIDLGYDILKVCDIAEKYIDPLLQSYKQTDSISILSGYSKFHSSFQPVIDKFASKHNVDKRKLMLELCKIDVLHAPDDLVEKIALSIKNS